MIDLLVKFPTRARPDLFRATLAKWQQDPLPRFLVTCDLDDPMMNNPGMRDWLAGQERLKVRFGTCKSKIEAVNDGVADEPWSHLVLAADDMTPQRPDYAARIMSIFAEKFPLGDGVLHLNDGRTGRMLNTLPVIDRRYFDRTGYIYNPAFVSLWADNEFQEVSERLQRSVYVDEVLVRHEWIGQTAPDDELHRRNEKFYAADQATFLKRRAAGFPR